MINSLLSLLYLNPLAAPPTMAATVKPMEPITAYTNLTTNLPQWISDIQSLSEYASKKHAFFVAEYTRLLSDAQSKPKRIKSPSISTIHTNGEKKSIQSPPVEKDGTEPLKPNPAEISPFEPGNKYLYAQARRKRKPDSSIRSGASGPQKFRSKQMVIIYYDSYLQEQLDGMVRKLGAARNELRKAKATATAGRGFQLPKLGRRYESILNTSGDDMKLSMSLSGKHGSTAEDPATDATFDPLAESSFSSADRGLEVAQTLCETAAHQFLRDGDCKTELESAPTRLKIVLELARVAAQRLEADKKEKESRAEEDKTPADSDPTLCEKPSTEALSNKLGPTLSDRIDMTHPLGLGTMEIEVDDGTASDASTMEVDIKNFRMSRRAGTRA